MKAYTRDEQVKVRTQALIKEWQRSGFIEAAQVPQLEAGLNTDFKRTNASFRLLLALFALIILVASLALAGTFFRLNDRSSDAGLGIIAGLLCAATAGFLINRFRLYRFGVEESLAFAAPVLFGIAAAAMTFPTKELWWGFGVAAVSFLVVYLWFGYIETALASFVCTAAIPFTLDLSAEMQRSSAAVFFLIVFFFVRSRRLRYGDDFPGNQYGVLQGAAWAGLYLALNLQFGHYLNPHRAFYWSTYALTTILPILGLRLALRDKDRYLIHVSLAAALVTLGTNKPYLGLPRQPWDPLLFGILLMGSAVLLRRWLSRGANGQRYGFTAARVLASEQRILSVVATASAALHQPGISATEASPLKLDPGWGRSGGAGASGSF
jgi:hypothetical protein